MEGTPLLDVLRGLILEPETQAEFAADPSGYMERFGYADVPAEDLAEAVGLVSDTLPPDIAHALNAATAPGDLDDGTVGLLARISAIEVTESVVPDPHDLEPGLGYDDAEHDPTAFGEVARDFDDPDDPADHDDHDHAGHDRDPDLDPDDHDHAGPDPDPDGHAGHAGRDPDDDGTEVVDADHDHAGPGAHGPEAGGSVLDAGGHPGAGYGGEAVDAESVHDVSFGDDTGFDDDLAAGRHASGASAAHAQAGSETHPTAETDTATAVDADPGDTHAASPPDPLGDDGFDATGAGPEAFGQGDAAGDAHGYGPDGGIHAPDLGDTDPGRTGLGDDAHDPFADDLDDPDDPEGLDDLDGGYGTDIGPVGDDGHDGHAYDDGDDAYDPDSGDDAHDGADHAGPYAADHGDDIGLF